MKKAKESMFRAQKLDSSIKNKYKALALELLTRCKMKFLCLLIKE